MRQPIGSFQLPLALLAVGKAPQGMGIPDQQQSSADRSRRSGCGLLPMQAMSRRCNIPFRLKRRLKR